MVEKDKHNWDNYWQGRSASESGNALLGVGIENNDVLTSFWTEKLSKAHNGSVLIDLACGAGSVLRQAKACGLTHLTGLDISDSAIKVLTEKMPSVEGVISPVDNTPFENEQFDIVASQFGFEYAGSTENVLSAAKEMVRILKPRGQIILVSHIADGAISAECQRSLEQIMAITDSLFIEKCMKTLKAVYKANEKSHSRFADKAKESMADLNAAAAPIMTNLNGKSGKYSEFEKFIYYLLESSHKLLMNYKSYSLEDSVRWLQAMRGEIVAYQGRMESMIQAALSQRQIDELLAVFKGHDMVSISTGKLVFKDKDLPAAWTIMAEKQ